MALNSIAGQTGRGTASKQTDSEGDFPGPLAGTEQELARPGSAFPAQRCKEFRNVHFAFHCPRLSKHRSKNAAKIQMDRAKFLHSVRSCLNNSARGFRAEDFRNETGVAYCQPLQVVKRPPRQRALDVVWHNLPNICKFHSACQQELTMPVH